MCNRKEGSIYMQNTSRNVAFTRPYCGHTILNSAQCFSEIARAAFKYLYHDNSNCFFVIWWVNHVMNNNIPWDYVHDIFHLLWILSRFLCAFQILQYWRILIRNLQTPGPFSLGKLSFFFDHGISESRKHQPNNDFLLLYRNQSSNLRFRSTNFRI